MPNSSQKHRKTRLNIENHNLTFLPRSVVQRIRSEAEKLGMGLEEYLVDLVTRNLDPSERAQEYIEAAREFLERSREELRAGNIRQSAEKAWGAVALAVKAYAAWKEERILS